jgi:hypothetical protein
MRSMVTDDYAILVIQRCCTEYRVHLAFSETNSKEPFPLIVRACHLYSGTTYSNFCWYVDVFDQMIRRIPLKANEA